MQRLISRLLLIPLVLSFCFAGCNRSTASLANEPQDLVGPGRELSELRQLGWTISEPKSISELESKRRTVDGQRRFEGEEWDRLKNEAEPGDEFRTISHNAGSGVALFRDGKLLDSYLDAVF